MRLNVFNSMKKLKFILSIAILTACGGKKAEPSATKNAEINQVASANETSEVNSETNKSQEKRNCDPSRVLVMLDDPDKSGTNIRNSPGGKVIATI